MALESAPLPDLEDFNLLPQHRQQTPNSFFGGKPVLHLRCPNARIRITNEDLTSQPALSNLRHENSGTESSDGENEVVIDDIDVWVSSSHLALASSAKPSCVQIPYQTITIHAQDGDAVLLHLNLSDANTADEDIVYVQFRVIPTTIESYEQPTESGESEQPNGHGAEAEGPAKALFQAIADCQELNPDPPEEGDEEYDETAPGATGWITSENMQDYLDENGELKIPEGATYIDGEGEDGEAEPLGEGAGRVRTASELDAEDGADEEQKWQRTG